MNNWTKYQCYECRKEFGSIISLLQHKEMKHKETLNFFNVRDKLQKFQEELHSETPIVQMSQEKEVIEKILDLDPKDFENLQVLDISIPAKESIMKLMKKLFRAPIKLVRLTITREEPYYKLIHIEWTEMSILRKYYIMKLRGSFNEYIGRWAVLGEKEDIKIYKRYNDAINYAVDRILKKAKRTIYSADY